MSKVKKYIILIILFIITISCNACFNKTISFKEYKDILEDISLMEQDYKNIKDKVYEKEEKYLYNICNQIDSVTAGNNEQYTFYLSKLNLDKYYILSSYTTIDNIKTKDERKEMTSNKLMNYYENLTWVKYKTKEDIQEEYNELILVESYIVSSITIIKDIISDKTYNKKINYYKILDENIKEDENILLWYHKDIDNMEDKYIGYPIYLDSHPVIYGDDFNNSYSKNIDSYVIFKNYGTNGGYSPVGIQIQGYRIYDDSLNKIEYKEDGTTKTIERFKVNTKVIKNICLGIDNNTSYKLYIKELEDISYLEQYYYSGRVYGDRERDRGPKHDFCYQIKYILNQNKKNYEHKYTFYLANIDLDNYYILSSYTTKDRIIGITNREASGQTSRFNYYKTLTWVKYDKLEDVTEEYNGLKLVESYMVAKITLIKDIINDIPYNVTMNYYKIPKYELMTENENILLWYYENANEMEIKEVNSDGTVDIYPKYIGYPNYVYAQQVCYGNDINNSYNESLKSYAILKEDQIINFKNYEELIYEKIKNYSTYDEKFDETVIYANQEFVIKSFKLDINIIKEICLGE